MSLPIDAQVSAKLKAKIWVNGFLDFGLLLSSTPGGARYNISVTANAGSAAPTLCLHSPHKRPNPYVVLRCGLQPSRSLLVYIQCKGQI